MGMSTNGMLVYGYNLGGDEGGWGVAEAGEYGELEVGWFNPLDDDEADFVTAAEKRLLAAAGFTETDWQAEGYFAREREAKAALGVEFDSYCTGDYPMYVLATKVITAYGGDVKDVDMVELVEAPKVHGWDAKLRAALKTLGLTPKQESPRWLLCSYRG
jgi:hypothetical protein